MSTSDAGSVTDVKVAQPDELERIRNEEYKIWKKQSPFLYDICISKAMQSPSASVQWFPEPVKSSSESPFETYRLLMTSSEVFGGTDSVFTAACDLPSPGASPDTISRYGSKNSSFLNIVRTDKVHTLSSGDFPLVTRFSEKDPSLVAWGGKNGKMGTFKGDTKLPDFTHHTKDIFDLAWNPHNAVQFVSVSMDGTAALWDASAAATSNSGSESVVPTQTFAGDNAVGYGESVAQPIFATQFSPLNANELVTAGDDRTIRFWDLRAPLNSHVRAITDAHPTGITAINYSPLNELLLATGSADGSVSLWDVRMSSASLVGLQADAGPVNALKWSPHDESVFATGGADAQVKVWDLSMHGHQQSAADEEEGPPELIFVHGGHLNSVSDLAWHPILDWTLCSVSEDSLVGIWKIASAIVDSEAKK